MASYDESSGYAADQKAPTLQYLSRSPSKTIYSTAKSIAVIPVNTVFEDYQPQDGYSLDEQQLANIVLPPPNLSCYQDPPLPQGEVRYVKHEEPTIIKSITQNFNSLKTVVKENTIHHHHNKTVVTNVNRNHWHTQRVVVKDNHFHHHLTNNVIRVADIHHQKIEQVRGEGKTINDFKQTQRVEAPSCIVDNNNTVVVESDNQANDGNEVINLVAPSVVIEESNDSQATRTLASQSQWWKQ